MWPFRSKTQKKLDALQDVVNARRLGQACERIANIARL